MSKHKEYTRFEDGVIKNMVLEVLGIAKKSMSLVEIQKKVGLADRKIMRELERENKIKKIGHFVENSLKTFTHPITKKISLIQGQKVFSYELVKIKTVEGDI